MSEFMNYFMKCRDCGVVAENVVFGRCPACQKKHDLIASWENTYAYVQVVMRKEEYNIYYKGLGYDASGIYRPDNSEDPEITGVYIPVNEIEEAKKRHEDFERRYADDRNQATQN